MKTDKEGEELEGKGAEAASTRKKGKMQTGRARCVVSVLVLWTCCQSRALDFLLNEWTDLCVFEGRMPPFRYWCWNQNASYPS